MAAVATVTKKYGIGGTATLYVGTIAFDATYPSGGEAIDLGGNETVEIMLCAPSGGYVYLWDKANQKLLVYYGDNNNAADGPLIENATADISALTAVPFLAIGS
jgi:hypothetical protein